MRDTISIERVAKLHPLVRAEVIAMIDEVEAGMPANEAIRITQGLRTIEEQDALYAQGRTRPGKIVTNAKGGSSYHNYGLAFDYAKLVNGKIDWSIHKPLVDLAKKKFWQWGGDFKSIKDNPHFQKTFGKTIKQLKALYKPGAYVKL